MHEIVWDFQPARGREREFEAAYGSTGPWVALFRRDPSYIGTELVAPREAGGWYRTIDRWESAAAYERFRQTWDAEYVAGRGMNHGSPYLYERTVPLFVRASGGETEAGRAIDAPVDFTAYATIEAALLGLDPKTPRALLDAATAR